MNEILPAIIPKSGKDLEDKVELVSELVRTVHIDVLESDIWADIHTDFEAHLMIRDPETVMERWIERGARRIIVHKLTDWILEQGHQVEIGLGVELNEPMEEVLERIPDVDFIHLMSIDALGTQGDNFEPKVFERIKAILRAYPEAIISVDGGVDLENADDLFSAGVERLAVGSAIFNASDPLEALEDFLELTHIHATH